MHKSVRTRRGDAAYHRESCGADDDEEGGEGDCVPLAAVVHESVRYLSQRLGQDGLEDDHAQSGGEAHGHDGGRGQGHRDGARAARLVQIIGQEGTPEDVKAKIKKTPPPPQLLRGLSKKRNTRYNLHSPKLSEAKLLFLKSSFHQALP